MIINIPLSNNCFIDKQPTHDTSSSERKSVTKFCKRFFILMHLVCKLRQRFEKALLKMLVFNSMRECQSEISFNKALAQDQDIVYEIKYRILEDRTKLYRRYLQYLQNEYDIFERLQLPSQIKLALSERQLLSELPRSKVVSQLNVCDIESIELIAKQETLDSILQLSFNAGFHLIPRSSSSLMKLT